MVKYMSCWRAVLLVILWVGGLLQSQAQELDSTFHIQFRSLAVPHSLVRLPDGSLVATAPNPYMNGEEYSSLIRLLPSGQIDTAFARQSSDIALQLGSYHAEGRCLILPDGDILLASFGAELRLKSTGKDYWAVRLHPNGEIVRGYEWPDQMTGQGMRTVLALPNGKFLLGGYGTDPARKVCRFNADGSFDHSFSAFIQTNSYYSGVFALALQSDGRIIVGGNFVQPAQSLIRLQPDGAYDASFQAGANANTAVHELDVLPDDRILVAGGASNRLHTAASGLHCLLPDGALDTGFSSPAGLSFTAAGDQSRVLPLPGGQLLLTPSAPESQTLLRLLPDGQADPDFSVPSPAPVQPITASLDGQGGVFVGGVFRHKSGQPGTIWHVQGAGQLDPAFRPLLYGPGAVWCLRESQHGLLVSGSFDMVNDQPAPNVVRLTPAGQLDTAFVRASPVVSNVMGIAERPDGRLVLAASGSPSLLQLHPSGRLDASFQVVEKVARGFFSVGLLPSGRVVLGGYRHIDQLSFTDANGVFDQQATVPLLIERTGGNITNIAVRADGTMYIAGETIFRLTHEGKLDAGFAPTTLNQYKSGLVRALAVMPDGGVVASGQMPSAAGTPGTIARFGPDGEQDLSFADMLSVFRFSVRALAVDSAGLVWAGGYNMNWLAGNSNSVLYLVRLRPDGYPDPLVPFFNGRGGVLALQQTANEELWVGGNFIAPLQAGQAPNMGLLRLRKTGLPLSTRPKHTVHMRLYPNPAHTEARLQWPATSRIATLQVLDALGREVRRLTVPAGHHTVLLDLRGLARGLYIVRAVDSVAVAPKRLLVQ